MLLAITEPAERCRFRLNWSTFRRQHQAVAKACHARRRCQQQGPPLGSPAIQSLRTDELELTEEHWARIAGLLPPQKPKTGRPNTDHRLILAGILWVIQTGYSWRELPAECGPWETVHGRYIRWRMAGIWQQILDILTQPGSAHAS
ncbi:MAG TPA: transposase [Actinomycetota bacterium]|nr:transposase [Actinomycetota bacterium]